MDEKKENLANSAISVCVQAQKSLEEYRVKPGTQTEKTVQKTMVLIWDTEYLLRRAMIETEEGVSTTLLEEGLLKIYEIDRNMKKVKCKYSPVQHLYIPITNCLTNTFKVIPAHDTDKDHGIFIPFPSPQKFANFIKQLIKG